MLPGHVEEHGLHSGGSAKQGLAPVATPRGRLTSYGTPLVPNSDLHHQMIWDFQSCSCAALKCA